MASKTEAASPLRPGKTKKRLLKQATLPDFADEMETPLMIAKDLLAVAINEIGNGGTRAIALLLASDRYLEDIRLMGARIQASGTTKHRPKAHRGSYG